MTVTGSIQRYYQSLGKEGDDDVRDSSPSARHLVASVASELRTGTTGHVSISSNGAETGWASGEVVVGKSVETSRSAGTVSGAGMERRV